MSIISINMNNPYLGLSLRQLNETLAFIRKSFTETDDETVKRDLIDKISLIKQAIKIQTPTK